MEESFFYYHMSNPFRKRLLQTQPHHETLFFETDSTLRNQSEACLKSASRTRPPEDLLWMQSRSINRSAPASPNKSSSRLKTHGSSMRRKYRQRYQHQPTPPPPQLHSPFIGLKVRRAVQSDFDFHSNFRRDEVLNYFAVPAGKCIKKRTVRNEGEGKTGRPQHRASKVQMRERVELKVEQRVPTKGSQQLSSQLSGWGVESDGVRLSSALDDNSYQIVSSYPSINAEFTQDATETMPVAFPSSTTSTPEEFDSSELELPQYSLKIVAPSEPNSSLKELISIKVVKEDLPSCDLVQETKQDQRIFKQVVTSKNNAASIGRLHSRMTLDPKSQLKVSSFKHSTARQKSFESLPINKENTEHRLDQSARDHEKAVSKKEVKLPSKGLLRGMVDSGKLSVNYSEDYACSQNLDENDVIRVAEHEETKVFRFERNKKTPPPSQLPVPSKERERKSVVIEKIEQFGSDCKNFFSSLADKINPFRQRPLEEDSDLAGSILALRTLNSRPDLDSHFSPREVQVRIREPTLMETQPWGMDSMQEREESLKEREGTTHDVRISAKDFSSEVRIALTNHAHQREEFYSQEYLIAQTEETVRQALAVDDPVDELIAQEAERMFEKNTEIVLQSLSLKERSNKEVVVKSIREEVADELAKLQEQIMLQLY